MGEPALLLDVRRLVIAVVVAAPEGRAAQVLEGVKLYLSERLGDVSLAPMRDADPESDLHLSRLGRGVGRMSPMLPMGRPSFFRHTAYVSLAERTSRMISRLFSTLVWTGQPAMGPTAGSLA